MGWLFTVPAKLKLLHLGRATINSFCCLACSSKPALEFGGWLLQAWRPRQTDQIKVGTTFSSCRRNEFEIFRPEWPFLTASPAIQLPASKTKIGAGTIAITTKNGPKYTNCTIDRNCKIDRMNDKGRESPCLNRELLRICGAVMCCWILNELLLKKAVKTFLNLAVTYKINVKNCF